MSSDVKLNDSTVDLVGNVTVHGTDLLVDAGADPARRSNQQPFRRALVHDYGDRLTLNWGKDYPGGVFLDGDVKIGDCLRTNHIVVPGTPADILKIEFAGAGPNHDGRIVLSNNWLGRSYMHCDVQVFELKNPAVNTTPTAGRAALTHTETDQLVLNDGGHYAGGVAIRGATSLDTVTVGAAASFNADVSFAKSLKIGNITIGTTGEAVLPSGPVTTGTTTRLDITGSTIRATTSQMSLPGHPPVQEVIDLVAEIRSLRQRVASLESQVKAKVPA